MCLTRPWSRSPDDTKIHNGCAQLDATAVHGLHHPRAHSEYGFVESSVPPRLRLMWRVYGYNTVRFVRQDERTEDMWDLSPRGQQRCARQVQGVVVLGLWVPTKKCYKKTSVESYMSKTSRRIVKHSDHQRRVMENKNGRKIEH